MIVIHKVVHAIINYPTGALDTRKIKVASVTHMFYSVVLLDYCFSICIRVGGDLAIYSKNYTITLPIPDLEPD